MSQTVTVKDGQTFTFPDDFTPDQIKAAMDQHYGKQPQLRAMPSPLARLRNRGVALLPDIGGFGGGLGGAALAAPSLNPALIYGAGVAGSALGGSLGEAGKEALSGQPLDAGRIAGQGALQGGYEVLGQGIARGAAKMAKPLIRKTVSFQRAATPSVILNEFGKPFMIEGKAVEFTKRPPKGATRAAEVAMDMASHSLGPGGALLRPVMRGLRGKVASGASGLGRFVSGPGFQNFARQFPRAAVALKHLATYEDSLGTSAPADATQP